MNDMNNNITLYTVSEVAKIIRTHKAYVYSLIKSNKLPAITNLGSMKVRHEALYNFLVANEGNDLTDPYDVKPYDVTGGDC